MNSVIGAEAAATGYRQELKRSLSMFDLLAYGLVIIVPLAPVSVFGIVFNASHGMVPLVYLIGVVAMIFIATSYAQMSRAFPFAGSTYAYSSRALGPSIGFLAGWAILLDYVLVPTLTYVVAAIAIQSVFPAVPRLLCIVVMIVIATAINIAGIEATARASFGLLAFQLLVLVAFAAAAAVGLAGHLHGAHLSLLPFYAPGLVTPQLVFGALSIAVLSFLGFDAISTLAEESRGGPRVVGRATILALFISALIFVAQTWLASLFLLDRTAIAPGTRTDEAFYDVASVVGGPVLKFVLAVPAIFFSSLAGAATSQAATARILYGMARDGEMPRVLAAVHPVRRIPTLAVYVVAGVSLVTCAFMSDKLELLSSMVSFGALVGFLTLQVAVVAHFIGRQRSRDYLRHLVSPLIGFLIISYVLVNAEANAKVAGGVWMTAGLILVGVRKLRRARAGEPVASES